MAAVVRMTRTDSDRKTAGGRGDGGRDGSGDGWGLYAADQSDLFIGDEDEGIDDSVRVEGLAAAEVVSDDTAGFFAGSSG